MKIEQIYTKCLAQGAYYIQSGGEAIIIDPLREIEPYLERVKRDGVTIKYILETHFHADFVSGHLDLAAATGAPIVYGPNAKTSFESYIAKDGEVFQLGEVTITVLHTPGHTLESTTYLLKDAEGKPHAIFTGDTLFLGDVGRPDLAQGGSLTQEELAGMLFDSLRSKIMTLPDDVIVYPAHGAGSACGKNMSKETVGILGDQKRLNYALREDMTREEFIQEVTDGLAAPPQYFPFNVSMNKDGYDSLKDVLKTGLKGLSPMEFELAAQATGAVILDTRHQNIFEQGFVPNSIFIGLHGSFAPWVGKMLLDIKQAILIVADEGKEEEVVTRLARVGYDNSIGYLKGGFEAWKQAGKAYHTMKSVEATVLNAAYEEGNAKVIDVRKPNEFMVGHLEGAKHVALVDVQLNLEKFPNSGEFFVHCRSGYRSMIAASILMAKGYEGVINVKGGYLAMDRLGMPMVEEVIHS